VVDSSWKLGSVLGLYCLEKFSIFIDFRTGKFVRIYGPQDRGGRLKRGEVFVGLVHGEKWRGDLVVEKKGPFLPFGEDVMLVLVQTQEWRFSN